MQKEAEKISYIFRKGMFTMVSRGLCVCHASLSFDLLFLVYIITDNSWSGAGLQTGELRSCPHVWIKELMEDSEAKSWSQMV